MKKAAQILRAQGIRAVFVRASARIAREKERRAALRRMHATWRSILAAGKQRPDIRFAPANEPIVSIIVSPSRSGARLTACLLAVKRYTSELMPFEVIVARDGDRNVGAQTAKGTYLCFLDEAVLVSPDWLSELLEVAYSSEDIAAVGPQLCTIDGQLLAAGGIAHDDGTVTSYGAGRSATASDYQYLRDVDYCSASALLVRASAFRDAGAFSPNAPTPERAGASLCARLRDSGLHVVYQPRSVVALVGGKAHARAARMPTVENATRKHQGRTILVMDSFVPFGDRDAGSRRLLAIVAMMRELGYHVMFLPEDGGHYEPYTSRLRRMGVEVRLHTGDATRELARLPVTPAAAWVSRPELAGKYLPTLNAMGVPTIYDTVDLHHVRLRRGEAIGTSADWRAMKATEMAVMNLARHVVVTSPVERDMLRGDGIEAAVVPIVERVRFGTPGFEQRQGLLFIGNYTHAPNVDGVRWLCTEIMPLIWDRIPEAILTIAGFQPTDEVKQLGSDDRVKVIGHMPDLRPAIDGARVLVAPLRYGAGMKGKIILALASGLPIVTTSVGAEGIALTNGIDAAVADEPAALAEAVARIYTNADIWSRMAAAGLATAERYSPASIRPGLAALFGKILGQDA